MVESRTAPFKPGIAAIVGILTTIFSITFLVLLYVKHCRRGAYVETSGGHGHPLARRNSGIDRKVIESLPLFRFSSLRGQKDGLECAVCLNRFEAEEVLRLLPKCKHAFHFECVDTWLDAHSTCPLCRYRVDPEDVLLVDGGALYNHGGDQVTPRNSDRRKGKSEQTPRVSGRHSSAGETGSSLEIIVENPGDDSRRGRISLDSWKSRRKTGDPVSSRSKSVDSCKSLAAENLGRRSKSSRKDGQLPVKADDADKHRLEHRIIISGSGGEAAEGMRRWSDVQAADMLYLGSEMLLESGRGVINERSVSEMTGVSRYRCNNGGGREREERERLEEGVVKRWLAWISQSQQPAVHSAPPPSSSSSS